MDPADPCPSYGAAVPRLVQSIHGWRGQLREVGLTAGHRPFIERELVGLQLLILRLASRPERLH